MGGHVGADVQGPAGGEGGLHLIAGGSQQGADEIGGVLVVDAAGEVGRALGEEAQIRTEGTGEEGRVLAGAVPLRSVEGATEGAVRQVKVEVAAGHGRARGPAATQKGRSSSSAPP